MSGPNPENITVVEGETIVLDCAIRPTGVLYWKKDGDYNLRQEGGKFKVADV